MIHGICTRRRHLYIWRCAGFSVNVNPYGPSEEVLEAAKRSMDEVSLYPDSQCRRLRKRLAEKKSLPEEYFLFGNGAAELFFSVVLAEKPKKALLPIPLRRI